MVLVGPRQEWGALAGQDLCLGLSSARVHVSTLRVQLEPVCVMPCWSSLTLSLHPVSRPSEVIRALPTLESLQRLFDQQLSPGLRPRPQVKTLGADETCAGGAWGVVCGEVGRRGNQCPRDFAGPPPLGRRSFRILPLSQVYASCPH